MVAGSLFATMQSLTMTGVLTGIGAGMIAFGGVWKLLRNFDWRSIFLLGAGNMILLGGLAQGGVSSLLLDVLRRLSGP